MAGDTIYKAAKEAIEISARSNCGVCFKFNDINIIVDKKNTVEDIVRQYFDGMDKAQKAYMASPEYAEKQRRDAIEIELKQKLHDDLMINLYNLKSESEILDWLYQFVELADEIRINTKREVVKAFLIGRGYKENDCVDQDKEFYKNKNNFAKYIIGQIITCWHPVAMKFIEDYRKMT